ncbi:MAG TPA: DUF1223 domain-containing protein [Pseudorhodoplanes sp.]|nr:DUF1223 domain-containing protein [Pseudorhodoplanes sp.]
MTRRVALLSAFAAALATSGVPAMAVEPQAVVELFTSQGCSSCPPADKLAGELSRDPSLVVLSLPVDYWDYLGWKDTLASPRNSAKQRAYSAMRGDRDVYTPQVVVNGEEHVLGSDKAAIERAILRTRASAMNVPVTLTKLGDRLTVSVPDGNGRGEVWLCSVATTIPVAIGRGENKGRTITYNNVSRGLVKLGEWTGKASTWTVPLNEIRRDGADAAAALVQSGSVQKPGPILGAAMTSLD